jgi:hypothetical protein
MTASSVSPAACSPSSPDLHWLHLRPSATFPGWLQAFAKVNPITVTAPEAGDRPAWMIKARRM